MKRILVIPVLIFLLNLSQTSVDAQIGNKDVVSRLNIFSSNYISEKVYLHFDKPYYATGDTIYFKAYTTTGERHDLSQLSGILHVDLINTANEINQSIKLQLANGLAWGDFALPDTLPKGNYRIRAYTQWMRNDGNYFEQNFPVGSLHNSKVPESSTSKKGNPLSKPDLQFFPEGGSLVDGIRSKITFKSIDNNGFGLDANGTVTDNSGKAVSEFASTHLGMGYFYLEPKEGETYKANITFADGGKNIIDLPVAESKGIVLNINNDPIPNASVRIEANKAYYNENKGREYSLLIYSGGISTNVAFKLDSLTIRMDIIKRHLHTGVARVTLFSPTGEPLSERLLFIQNYDHLYLAVNSDKTMYTAREKVNIKLNAKTRRDSAVTGHFSISVIDESKVPVDENTESTILTNLLLTSDLKGNVEQPNYYFTNITDETNKNLDLVMLTHGYRRFEWKQVLSNSYPPMAYQPEKDLEITGTAKNLSGRVLPKASVSLISTQNGQFISTVADDKGNFRFDNLYFMDSTKFILQAVNAKGRNNTQLIYNKDTSPSVTAPAFTGDDNFDQSMSAYLANDEKQQEELNKLGLGKGRILKEVKIKERKVDMSKVNPMLGFADQRIGGDKIRYGSQLAMRLMGLLHGIDIIYNPKTNSWDVINRMTKRTMKIYWNDILMRSDFDINSINTGSIESVEAYTNAASGAGALRILTTYGLQLNDVQSIGILPITAKGFYKAREFYSPKYESNLTTARTDLRSTAYWNPELVTDKNGNALFNFYNADGPGTYRLVIEGMDAKGNIGRQVYRYRVE